MVRACNIVFHILPMRFNLFLGYVIGGAAYYFSGRRAAITYANLKAAFTGEKGPSEIKKITKRVYKRAGETFSEMISMTKVNKKYIDKYVKVVNMDRIEKASGNPAGMILVSAHFGNWELSTVASAMKGFPLNVLARDQKMVRLYELFNKLRESKGNTVIRKGMDVKKIFRILKKGESVGLLADQNAGASGELVDFFSRPASAATGPYRFAQHSGAWVLPAFIHRVDGPYHELVLEEPMKIGKNDELRPYMERYNVLLEQHIRRFPDHWFWMHKRWKATPLKKVLVLDDGKRGHFKQSMAVVDQIKDHRRNEGVPEQYLDVEVAEVRYKGRWGKLFLNLSACFVSTAFQMHLKILKFALERTSYEHIVSRYADVVVSCGSSLFGVNRIVKLENSARNITVFDPGKYLRNRFNLIIAPRHDFKRGTGGLPGNMIITDMTPTAISPAGLARIAAEETGEKGMGASDKSIGVLAGGDNKWYRFTEEVAASLASSVNRACSEEGYVLHVTTSRRTPDNAENVLKSSFCGNPFCKKFVSGRMDTDEMTVEKIMAVSDIIIVSGESISMVSEAVASGKPVLVFIPHKITEKVTKYERFLNILERKELIKVVPVDKICDAVEDIKRGNIRFGHASDGEKISAMMYRLF